MSDPVPNDEADGVLSSIRRLVAEKPAGTSADPASVTDGGRTSRADRFVLTDALRVADPAPEAPRLKVGRDQGPTPDGAQPAAHDPDHIRSPATPVVLTGPTFAAPGDNGGAQELAATIMPMVQAATSRAVDGIVTGAGFSGRAPDDEGSRRGQREQEPEGAPLPLDEDALRRLVADVVRTELQGALGERITRNVRKLVRREVHRALLNQNID